LTISPKMFQNSRVHRTGVRGACHHRCPPRQGRQRGQRTPNLPILDKRESRYQSYKIEINLNYIVKIDSRTWPFSLLHYVLNGLFYPGEETWHKLCFKGRQANSGVSSHETNKDQLLHRIQSVPTFTNLQ